MRVNRAIKMAAKDGKVTRKEIKRIVQRSRGKINAKAIVSRIKKTDASVPMMLAMKTKKFLGKINSMMMMSDNNNSMMMMTDNTPTNMMADNTPTNMMMQVESTIKDDINAADELDSKKYQKFDYKKALKEGADRAKDRNDSAKKYTPMDSFKNDEARKKKISKKTGANLARINMMGLLKLKDGQMKAMAPSYKRYQMQIEGVQTPYAMLLGKIGSSTGVEYGAKARKARTQGRLEKLSNRLSSSNPIGSTENKKSGYGDAGTDLIKMFSKTKGASK